MAREGVTYKLAEFTMSPQEFARRARTTPGVPRYFIVRINHALSDRRVAVF